MKILAAIILFNPNKTEVIKNILQFINYIDTLIIWDNTPDRESVFFEELHNFSDRIVYKSTGKNMGIAYPINRCAEFAVEKDFTHFLTMDQDSYFLHFDAYISNIASFKSKTKIFGPQINENSNQINETYVNVDYVIQSGCVFDVSLFKEIGYFREDFFIDQVDIEFCYRAKRCGYQSILLSCSTLIHELGHSKGGKNILGKIHITSDNYPAFRRYYLVRNSIIVMRLYPENYSKEQIVYFIRKTVLRQILKILLSENNKLIKVYSILKGAINGVYYNFKK